MILKIGYVVRVVLPCLRSDPVATIIAPKLHEVKRGMTVKSLEVRESFETHRFIHFAGGGAAILR